MKRNELDSIVSLKSLYSKILALNQTPSMNVFIYKFSLDLGLMEP